MKTLSWNCCGLGSPRVVRALKRLVRNFSPHLICLQEMRLHQYEMENIRVSLRFDWLICVDCSGRFRSGGLALLWNSSYDISLQSFSLKHIDVNVADPSSTQVWRFTGIYGFPEESQKLKTWDLLRLLGPLSSLSWLCACDFNEILYNSEKKGGLPKTLSQLQAFQDVVDCCNLQDMGFEGYPFTWSNGREGGANVQLKLDSAFSTESLLLKFPFFKLIHGCRNGSDQFPLFIEMDSASLAPSNRNRIFRFEEAWTREIGCSDCIKQAWRNGDELNANLSRVQKELCKANLLGVTDFKKLIKNLEWSLETYQSLPLTPHNLDRQKQLCSDINDLLEREELWYRQCSRIEWLQFGDKNTKFFHKKASQRQ